MHIFNRVRAILNVASRLALWIAGAGMVAMTFVVGWQIFARYILNDTPSWAEPVVLQLMAWFILLGSAVGVREGFHLGLDILLFMMRPKIARLMELTTLILTSAFGAAMAYYSSLLAIGTWDARIPVLDLPGGFDFLPMIVGGALIAIFAAERFTAEILHVPSVALALPVEELV